MLRKDPRLVEPHAAPTDSAQPVIRSMVTYFSQNSPAFVAGATKAEAAATIRARKKRTRAMVAVLMSIV